MHADEQDEGKTMPQETVVPADARRRIGAAATPALSSPSKPSLMRRALAEAESLVTLAVPIVAGLAAATGVTLIDTAMIGPLGTAPLAATSLVSSVIVIFYAALYGFTGAIGLFAGKRFGAGEVAALGPIARHGGLLAFGAGVVGALLMAGVLPLLSRLGQPPEVVAVLEPYWLWMAASLPPYTLSTAGKHLIDATDRPWTGVFFTVAPLFVNATLNWLLIYGNWGFPALGLTGAGLASFLAQLFGAIIFWGYLRFAPSLAAWWPRERMTRKGFSEQMREGAPMTVQYFLEGAAVAVAGVLIGYFGATALAGNQIANAVGSTLYMLPLGVAAAVTIRVAQAIGMGKRARIAAIGHAGLGVVTLWMISFSILFVFGGEWIAGFFSADPAVIEMAGAIFFAFSMMQLMDGVQTVSLGALRGMFDNRWPTYVSLIAYWLVALPLSVLFSFVWGAGAVGVWIGFAIGLAAAAAALFWRFAIKTMEPIDG